jgi:hypothetical protein
MQRFGRAMALGLLGAALVVAPVSAGKPETIREPIDTTFLDDDLTAACGVDVHVHETGHITFRTFTDADGNPVREVNNYAVRVRLWSVNGEIRAQNVGADHATYLDDGSIVVFIAGNVVSFSIPGEGRFYSDVGRSMLVIDANGDPTFTPLSGQHDPDFEAAVCSVLGA